MDFRRPMETVQAIDALLESRTEKARTYLGISYAGEKCDRYIWLTFRWAAYEHKTGRIQRLLRRGQREEAEILRLLRSVGVVVTDTGRNQCLVTLTPWVKGHPDGIIRSGLKESPTNEHILEMKTSNDKAWQDLCKRGVQEAKPVHYTQMQLYMLGKNIERSFYWNTNKNNDDVYTERVYLDWIFANRKKERVEALSLERNLPGPLSDLPSWYECKMCPMWGICHNHEMPRCSCRTCEHGEFCADGKFHCKAKGKDIRNTGYICESFRLHYDLGALCLN